MDVERRRSAPGGRRLLRGVHPPTLWLDKANLGLDVDLPDRLAALAADSDAQAISSSYHSGKPDRI